MFNSDFVYSLNREVPINFLVKTFKTFCLEYANKFSLLKTTLTILVKHSFRSIYFQLIAFHQISIFCQ